MTSDVEPCYNVTCSNRTFSTMEFVKKKSICRWVGLTRIVQMPSKYVSTSIWVIWKWFVPNHVMNQNQITCFDFFWDLRTVDDGTLVWLSISDWTTKVFWIPKLDEAPTGNRELWQIHSISRCEMMFHLHRDTWKRDLSEKVRWNLVNQMHKSG